MDFDPLCGGLVSLDWSAAGTYGIFDGQTPTRLLPFMIGSPSWSPSGDQLAFGLDGEVFAIAFDGNSLDTLRVRQLTFNSGNYFPAWSPDGTSIAYEHTDCAGSTSLLDSTSCAVFIMSASGARKKPLVEGRDPSWYPDAHRVLFRGSRSEFFVYDLEDTTVVQLTEFNSSELKTWYPAVSPNGTMIAFASQPATSAVDIWLMNEDGTNLRRLTYGGTLSRFCWSPDSQYILYINYRAKDFSEDNGSLWIIDVQNGEKRRLVHGSLK